MVNFRSFIFIVFASLFTHYSYAQVKDYSFGEGLQYTAKDSTFGIKASLRFQSLFMANWNVHNDNLNDIGNLESNFLIRRARLKFRSEERRVGKECRARRTRYYLKRK